MTEERQQNSDEVNKIKEQIDNYEQVDSTNNETLFKVKAFKLFSD